MHLSVFLTVDSPNDILVGLGDQERDPEEQVDVAEEATVEEVHDALVQEERG